MKPDAVTVGWARQFLPRLSALVGPVVAAGIAAGLIADEGWVNKTYTDLAGIPTACVGDTVEVEEGVVYSDAQCAERLDERATDFTASVLACVPGISDRPNVLTASVRFAYNIGGPRFCTSTAARRFRSGEWAQGCDAFLMWDKVRIGGKKIVVEGLAKRRMRERMQCLSDLP